MCSQDSLSTPCRLYNHLSSSSSQYLFSLTSFSSLNLVTLLHLLSPHPFLKYSGIPSPFLTLCHLFYFDSLILSHLSCLCLLLSFSSKSLNHFLLALLPPSPLSWHPPSPKNSLFYFKLVLPLLTVSFISSKHFLAMSLPLPSSSLFSNLHALLSALSLSSSPPYRVPWCPF